MYDELDEDTRDLLESFDDKVDWVDFYYSTMNGEDSWLEIGNKDEEFRKNGGFDTRFTTESY